MSIKNFFKKLPIVSPKYLVLLSSIVWLVGGFNLLRKSIILFQTVLDYNSDLIPVLVAVFIGFILGIVKSIYIFKPFCIKNINRIYGLRNPKIWQFFTPTFFGALAVMIFSGILLSKLANGNYWFLLIVATLDLIIGLALMASFLIFLSRKKEPYS